MNRRIIDSDRLSSLSSEIQNRLKDLSTRCIGDPSACRFRKPIFLQDVPSKPEGYRGRLLYDLGNRQWDIPELRRLLEDILEENTEFEGYQIEHDFPEIGGGKMPLNARRISG
jgi:hypothetical protein